MTKETDATSFGRSGPTRKDIEEIVTGADLFEHPNIVPGAPARGLSPREMVAATYEAREDQTQSPGLFMVETPLNAIGKDGIQFLRKQYTGLDLIPLTTGPKNRLRQDLMMRYNRAELARGVLEEIVVLERDAQGVYTELGRARRSDVFRQDTDYSVVLRERAHYVQRLVETVKLDKEQFHRIESGTKALEELASAIHARERLQRKNRKEPIVSAARWDIDTPPTPEVDADYAAMKANRPEAASDSGAPDDLRLADLITGAGPLGESHESASIKGSRGRKKMGKKASERPAAEPAASTGEDDEGVLPMNGGTAGLADLLSDSPVPPDDHEPLPRDANVEER